MSNTRFTSGVELATGIGLRVPHYNHILAEKPAVGWFEIISENYMVEGGRALAVLDHILDQYRVVQHGVGMYPGDAGGVKFDHLRRLKRLVRRTNTPWISDHLCWGSVDGVCEDGVFEELAKLVHRNRSLLELVCRPA